MGKDVVLDLNKLEYSRGKDDLSQCFWEIVLKYFCLISIVTPSPIPGKGRGTAFCILNFVKFW